PSNPCGFGFGCVFVFVYLVLRSLLIFLCFGIIAWTDRMVKFTVYLRSLLSLSALLFVRVWVWVCVCVCVSRASQSAHILMFWNYCLDGPDGKVYCISPLSSLPLCSVIRAGLGLGVCLCLCISCFAVCSYSYVLE